MQSPALAKVNVQLDFASDTNSLISIVIGQERFTLNRQQLEKDFNDLDDLFDGPEPYRVDTNLQKGWKALLGLLAPTPTKPEFASFAEAREFIQVVLLTGSKKGMIEAEEMELPLHQETKQFYHELCGKYPPNSSKDADSLICQLFSGLQLEDTFIERAKSYRQLTFHSAKSALTQDFSSYFPNVTTLELNQALPWKTFLQLLKAPNKLQSLKARVFNKQTINLEAFASCQALSHLSLRGEKTPHELVEETFGVSRFENPQTLTKLKTLILKELRLPRKTVSSISNLSLQMLELRSCSLVNPKELLKLRRCTQLNLLDLRDMIQIGSPDSAILHLHQRLPKCNVLPEVTLTDYSEVFCTDPSRSKTSLFYAHEARFIQSPFLKKLLNDRTSQERWTTSVALSKKNHPFNSTILPWDHNFLFWLRYYFSASPIKALDNRLRIATQEPVDNVVQGDFWQTVLDCDVSVIVMLKEVEEKRYFPVFGTSVTYYGQLNEPITVQCESEKNLEPGITLRTFCIGSKKIKHLQINWQDMCGLDSKLLQRLLALFQTLEEESPGASMVHCKAGAGRTGTFFACLLISQLMNKNPHREMRLDLEILLTVLREQRMTLILTAEQLHSVLEFFAEKYDQFFCSTIA